MGRCQSQDQTPPAVLPAVLPAERRDGKGQVRKWGMKMALEGGGSKRRRSGQKSVESCLGKGHQPAGRCRIQPQFSLKLPE